MLENIPFFLDYFRRIVQSNITKEQHKRFGWLPTEVPILNGACWDFEMRYFVHDFLISMAFVLMVTSPALIASSTKSEIREDL